MEDIVWAGLLLITFLLAVGLLAYALWHQQKWVWELTDSKTYTRLLSIRPHLIPSLVTALMLIMATMKIYHPSVYHPSVYHPPTSLRGYPSGTLDPAYNTPAYYTGWGFFAPSDGYFLLLRWVVMVVSLYIAYKGYQWKKTWVSWLFVFIAILFNPIVQITFERASWQVFDVLSALAFLTAGFLIKQPDIPKKENIGLE